MAFSMSDVVLDCFVVSTTYSCVNCTEVQLCRARYCPCGTLKTANDRGGTEGGAGGAGGAIAPALLRKVGIATPLFQNEYGKWLSTTRADPEINTLMMNCQAVQSSNDVNKIPYGGKLSK